MPPAAGTMLLPPCWETWCSWFDEVQLDGKGAIPVVIVHDGEASFSRSVWIS